MESILIEADCLDFAARGYFVWLLAKLREQGCLKEAGGEERSPTPRVPTRPADLRRWKETWRRIKPQAEQAKPYKDISDWLKDMHPHLSCSPEIIGEIIQAGEGGHLDK